MKKLNLILKKCKTLSKQLGRTSSYSSLRSKSARDHHMMIMQDEHQEQEDPNNDNLEDCETIFVGSSRRRFLVKSKYLNHPLLKTILQKSNGKNSNNNNNPGEDHQKEDYVSVKCEVVLFDHLLWMLDNADPNLTSDDTLSVEELADLYVF
ncbi:hypothetical protein ACH5RR_038173 [Cinchona calisaya]|uniref:Small auxin up regulated protein n=1 Tax=Cinchona calisaya TaxID=153742 RepID=A0ABD2YC29_9GENT